MTNVIIWNVWRHVNYADLKPVKRPIVKIYVKSINKSSIYDENWAYHSRLAQSVRRDIDWTPVHIKPKFFKLVVCNPFQSSPSSFHFGLFFPFWSNNLAGVAKTCPLSFRLEPGIARLQARVAAGGLTSRLAPRRSAGTGLSEVGMVGVDFWHWVGLESKGFVKKGIFSRLFLPAV